MIYSIANPTLNNKEITVTNVRRITVAKIDDKPDAARGIQIQTDLGTELILLLIPENGKEILID